MNRDDVKEKRCSLFPLDDNSSWKYVGEGGKHAIFAYQPEDEVANTTTMTTRKWLGQLLRIKKEDLVRSLSAVSCATELGVAKFASSDDGFHVLVHSILHPYVDLPVVARLPWTFVAALHDAALNDGRIPNHRRRDWLRDEKKNDIIVEHAPVGFLMKDYRLSLTVGRQRIVSVEFKPKAGYRAFSPLVAQNHRSKFTQSRFVLLQKFYSDGKVAKDSIDVSDRFEVSSYDPIDFFSNDGLRVRCAVNSLITCPQNNLNVWSGGKPLIGAYKQLSGPLFDWRSFGETLGIPMTAEDRVVENNITSLVVELTISVLLDEPFLSDLLQLQKLDILDADGAISVYQRLVSLCNGDQDQADQLVDFVPNEKICSSTPLHSLLRASPIPLPGEAANIEALCSEIETFAQLLESGRPRLPTQGQMDDSRMRASELIERLSIEECCYLLQTWLLSLSMCDLSFFITFRTASSSEDVMKVDQLMNLPSCNDYLRCRIISKQKHCSPGCLVYRSSESQAADFDGILLYELKAIDFDRKPARKLRSRHIKEAFFDTPET